jgi:uncharacterized protein YggE
MYRYVWLITLLVLATIAIAMADGLESGISVDGQAEVKVAPNLAVISFGVSTTDANAESAAAVNAKTTSAVIAALTAFGVAKSDIETSSYSVSSLIDYKGSSPKTIGYTVSNRVRVKLRDLAKTGAIIDTCMKAGANEVSGVSFTIENEDSVRQRALIEATKNAEAKARAVADALGVKLGKVALFTEGGGVMPRPVDFAMAKSDVATPILPGEVGVTAKVRIVYSIL